jgi:hypothetical protein
MGKFLFPPHINLCKLSMTNKEKLIVLRQQHPEATYRYLAQLAGCDESVAKYHLNPKYKANKLAWCKKRDKREQRELKAKLVAQKGGACIICGYNNYFGALDFHHLNPKTKEFNFNQLRKAKPEKLQKELDKCVLLCCRCHREVHGGVIFLKQ